MKTRWWAVAITVLGLAAAAPPASAAFPGANGELAVTPISGNGVLIASPQTGRARRVCDAPQRCGAKPANPRFSPNGREVIFRAADGSVEITTMAGACVWCVSPPELMTRGTDPTFTPGGATITYKDHWLWELTPGAVRATRLRVVGGPVSAVAWAPGGKVAAVRRGWLWTGTRKANTVFIETRLTRGSAPAWSPGGQLAFTRKGVVFTIRTAGHRVTRIARGTSPAFSPDGRSLAYLNQRHQVVIRPLNGHGPSRVLTRLRGRSVDWQPVTAITRRGCAAGNGAVVASNGTATIRAAANPKQGHTGWNGCLTALGIPFHLSGGFSDPYSDDLSLGQVALSGNDAALQFIENGKDEGYSEAIDVYDLRSGALVRTGPVRCGGLPCGLTGLAVNADGFAAWHAFDTPARPESQMTPPSCPSASLCVASDNSGDLLTSSDPTGGRSAWTLFQPTGPSLFADGVSCPTTSFCVALDGAGHVITSTNPAAGAGAWQVSPVNPTLQGGGQLSCASPTLCAAVNGLRVATTTNPTGDWHSAELTFPADELTGVACPSATLCLVTTQRGEVLVTKDAADAAPTWTAAATLPGQTGDSDLVGLNCPSATFCAAVATSRSGNSVLTTTDPAGGAATWTAHPLANAQWVTCPSTALCVAFLGQDVATSTDPTDPSPTWTTTPLPGNGADLGTCPTTSLCVAAGGPHAVVSTNPTGGSSAWSSFLVAALPCDPASPCRAEALQALDDQGLHTLDTAPQGTGTVISDPTLTGDTLSWTNDGAPRSIGLN